MKTAERTVEIKGQTGISKVTIIVTRGVETKAKEVDLDGDILLSENEEIVNNCQMTLTAPNGKVFTDLYLTFAHGMDVLRTGDTFIGINKEAKEAVEKSLADAEKEAGTDPEYKAAIAAEKKEEKEYNEYMAHVKRVDDMMTLDGKSY